MNHKTCRYTKWNAAVQKIVELTIADGIDWSTDNHLPGRGCDNGYRATICGRSITVRLAGNGNRWLIAFSDNTAGYYVWPVSATQVKQLAHEISRQLGRRTELYSEFLNMLLGEARENNDEDRGDS